MTNDELRNERESADADAAESDGRYPETGSAPRHNRLGLTDEQKVKLARALGGAQKVDIGRGRFVIDSGAVINNLNEIIGYGEWYTIHETKYVDYDGIKVFESRTRLYVYDVFVAELYGSAAVLWPRADKDDDYNRASAIGTAKKKAETNGLKRCARVLGRQFGSDVSDDNQDEATTSFNDDFEYGGAYGANESSDVYPGGMQDQAQSQAQPKTDPNWDRFLSFLVERGKTQPDVAYELGIGSASKANVVDWAKRNNMGWGGVVDYLSERWDNQVAGSDDGIGDGESAGVNGAAPDAQANANGGADLFPADVGGSYVDWDDFKRETDAFFAWLDANNIQPAQAANILEFGDEDGAYSSKLFNYCMERGARLADVQTRLAFELRLPETGEYAAG